jgi:hypothetical protein
MNEQVSALDFGLYRFELFLQDEVHRWFADNESVHVGVFYDRDKDEVNLHVDSRRGGRSQDDSRDVCTRFIEHVRNYAAFGDLPSLLEAYFGHAGYAPVSQPKDLYSDLAKRIVLTCSVAWAKKDGKYGGETSARALVNEDKIYFAE